MTPTKDKRNNPTLRAEIILTIEKMVKDIMPTEEETK